MAGVVLFDDQAEVLEKISACWCAGHRAVMLYSPTGGGKTEIAIHMMDRTARRSKRSAMLLDRIILVEQTSKRLQKYGIDHGVLQSGHWRFRPHERIQVCSAQTLEARGSFPGLSLLIVDEAHDQRADTLQFIHTHTQPKEGEEEEAKLFAVGLSASPFSDGLADTYTAVVMATTTKKLVEEGRLVPLKVVICREVDVSKKKPKDGEWTAAQVESEALKITGDIVAEWIVQTHFYFGGPRKTVVFCAGVKHGADLAQQFAKQGYNFVAISYRDTSEYKRQVIEEFEKPDSTIQGLIACDILTKGFDVPDVMIGVDARPLKKSFNKHVQKLGRPMRAAPWAGKEFALWLCHSGNYLRFRAMWDHLYEHGVSELKDGVERSMKEPTIQEKEAAKCPKCKALWIGRGLVCAKCGYERPALNVVHAEHGEMVPLEEIDQKQKVSPAEKQRWYSELLKIEADRGYSSGWADHKFKSKFDHWPRGCKKELAAAVSPDVASWEKSRRIAFVKAKAKNAAQGGPAAT